MQQSNIIKYFNIDSYSSTPKYLQLTNAIFEAIKAGKIKKNDLLPSINEVSFVFDISRDTVEKGYKRLKKLGVITSVPGKGYFINDTKVEHTLRVALFFNKLSSHKKIIYDSFVEALGENVTIDFYIYNNEYLLFKKFLSKSLEQNYSHYVIIPHFTEGGANVHEIINTIPKDKLLLLDKKLPGVEGDYAAVYENFEKDIYNALEIALDLLSKYHTLKIIFPKPGYFPEEILTGFIKFCRQYAFSYDIITDVLKAEIKKGEVYINLMEDDLVTLIEKLICLNLKVGEDVGVISYNETPIKKIILNGITTISTDFKYMGATAATIIKEKEKMHVEVPFHVVKRNSL